MSFDFSRARQAQAVRQERQAAFKPRDYLFFKIGDGDAAVVRFLGLQGAWCHAVTRPKSKYPDWIPSLDQSQYPDGDSNCPMVQRDLKRSFRGWVSLIWRDAPNYKRNNDGGYAKDQNGNLIQIGVKDQIAVWNTGLGVFNTLDGIDAKFRGLGSRDFEIVRSGTGLDTTYQIMPADPDSDPVPMDDADLKIAAKAPDLNEFVTPPSREDILKLLSGLPTDDSRQSDGGGGNTSSSVSRANPFMRGRG